MKSLDSISPEHRKRVEALLHEAHPFEGSPAWYAQQLFGRLNYKADPPPVLPAPQRVHVHQMLADKKAAPERAVPIEELDIAERMLLRKEALAMGTMKEAPLPARKRHIPKPTHNARGIYEKNTKPYTPVPEELNKVVLNTGGPHTIVVLPPDPDMDMREVHVCDGCRSPWVRRGRYRFNIFAQERLPQDTAQICEGPPDGFCIRSATMTLMVTYES